MEINKCEKILAVYRYRLRELITGDRGRNARGSVRAQLGSTAAFFTSAIWWTLLVFVLLIRWL